MSIQRTTLCAIFVVLLCRVTLGQRITDDLVVLYDFNAGQGNVVFDRGPSLGVPGDPIDLTFDPNELSSEPIAGRSGDRPGLISWGDSWLNINKDHPVDDGTAHGTPDAAVVWTEGGPGTASKIVDMVTESGQFTIEAWVRPASINNRSNPGRIAFMTVEGTSDESNFVLGQQSCCDGGGQPGGVQIRLNTETPGNGTRVTLNSEGSLFEGDQLIHVTHTHDTEFEETFVYVNREGESFDDLPVIEEFIPGFDLAGWDPDYVLAVGNDPYRFSRWFGGELHLIAIYDRAFSVDEIQSHFELGPGTTVPVTGDCNGDGVVNADDLACSCGPGGDLDATLAVLNTVRGDLDGVDGVAFGDFLTLSANFGKTEATYVQGDVDCNGEVAFADFLALSANFGQGGGAAAASVPEPTSVMIVATGLVWLSLARRRQTPRQTAALNNSSFPT